MTESSVALPLHIRDLLMERFVHIQNIAHFRKVLSETTDPTKQQTVQKLLAVELAKDRAPSK